MRLAIRSLPLRACAALVAATLLAAPVVACQAGTPGAAPKTSSTVGPAERAAFSAVKTDTVREVTTTLSSADMEGRGTATPGGEKAARYIADRFAKLGLKPLGDAGTYFQAVPFRTTQIAPETTVKAGDVALELGKEFVPAPPLPSDLSESTGALVFVGYGVVSPELGRDDIGTLDLKGKIAVVLQGMPKGVDAATWQRVASPQALFGGLLGRGIAGAVVCNVGATGRSFEQIAGYLSRRSVALATGAVGGFKLPPIVLVSDSGAEKLFAKSGTTYAQALEKAMTGERVSSDLAQSATLSVKVAQQTATGSNVAAILEGSDPALKDQAVLYSAHYDAFGKAADGGFYPGAADNALGVGEIVAIAEAFAKAPQRPRRSIIFLAVTGEEYGLLGAEYWVSHPTWPLEKISANVNYDGIGTEVYGPVKTIVAFGEEYSDLGPVARTVAEGVGMSVVPDPMPEERAFYRSDHYAFVKRGVPALMLLGAPAADKDALVKRIRAWIAADYHQTTDTIRPNWHWEGARDVAALGFVVGLRVANADAMAAWLDSSPFKRAAAAR
jgi:hypothetical protein